MILEFSAVMRRVKSLLSEGVDTRSYPVVMVYVYFVRDRRTQIATDCVLAVAPLHVRMSAKPKPVNLSMRRSASCFMFAVHSYTAVVCTPLEDGIVSEFCQYRDMRPSSVAHDVVEFSHDPGSPHGPTMIDVPEDVPIHEYQIGEGTLEEDMTWLNHNRRQIPPHTLDEYECPASDEADLTSYIYDHDDHD